MPPKNEYEVMKMKNPNNQIDKETLFNEAMDFIDSVYEAGVFASELDEASWYTRVSPPFYVMYLQYVRHYYNEYDVTDIDDLCDYYMSKMTCDDEQFLEGILSRMKSTNHEFDGIISQVRTNCEKMIDDSMMQLMGGSYVVAFEMLPYFLFQLKPSIEGGEKIASLAKQKSEYREVIEEKLLLRKDTILDVSNDIVSLIRNKLESEEEISLIDSDGALFGFGLFCCKYFISHSMPVEWLKKYYSKYLYRGYFSQYFVKTLIGDRFKGNSQSATMSYSMWNHLNHNIDTSDSSTALLNSVIATLYNSINTELDLENDMIKIIILDVTHDIADYLNKRELILT